ncbi:hypothetical protein ACHAXN_006827 [Cyclotella atomus]
MKLFLITAFICSSTVGGKLGFAKAVGDWIETRSDNETAQDESPETAGANVAEFDCATIRVIWEEDPNAFLGTKFMDIKDLCDKGVLSTAEDVAAAIEQVAAPNPSADGQIADIAAELCDFVLSGNVEPDADVSEIEAACSAESRDDEAVVDAASILQAERAPKDEDTDAALKETCMSIAANRDKIDTALLVLAARSERKLQDDAGNETTPVTSFEVASEMLSMYDCICDQTNPENIGCMKKVLMFGDLVSRSIDEQAATDFDPERILDDLDETVEFVKKHATHLRHSGYDSYDVDLSVERALSESNVGECDPPGISDTPQNGGKKLCIYAGKVFECELNWNPHSAGCVAMECGAGAVVQVNSLFSSSQFFCILSDV